MLVNPRSPFIDQTRMMDAPIVGTPDDIYPQLKAFIDLCVDHFMLRFLDFSHTKSRQIICANNHRKRISEFLLRLKLSYRYRL